MVVVGAKFETARLTLAGVFIMNLLLVLLSPRSALVSAAVEADLLPVFNFASPNFLNIHVTIFGKLANTSRLKLDSLG